MNIEEKLLPLGKINNTNALEYLELMKTYNSYERDWCMLSLIDHYTDAQLKQANIMSFMSCYTQSLVNINNNTDKHSDVDIYVSQNVKARIYVKAGESKDNVKLYIETSGYTFSDFYKSARHYNDGCDVMKHLALHFSQPYGCEKFTDKSGESEFQPINLRELKIDSLLS